MRVWGLYCALAMLAVVPAHAQTKTLNAMFTPAAIQVDGLREEAWNQAAPSDISICWNARRTAQLTDCKVQGTVQALWNGPTLYLLFSVSDPDVATTAAMEMGRSGVQVFVDQFNDKFPKFEEDDGYVMVSAAGQQTGNRTNAGLPYYPAVWASHWKASAATERFDAHGALVGYTVELAWAIGDRPLQDGTKLGMEFAINVVQSAANASPYQLFWSSGNNKGVNDNTAWGEVTLAGHGGAARMPLNTFLLEQNVKKATPAGSSDAGLVRGIWSDETAVDRALAAGKSALLKATKQAEIDAANTALEAALRGLRRSGKFPDPYDLPAVGYLPDPFTFLTGAKVKSAADWEKRRAEIKDLAQYYEFGYMPARPRALTAASAAGTAANSRTITVTVQDGGRTASFAPVLYLPATGAAPYPVIVQETFRAAAAPNRAFLDGGYAVLNIPATDNPAFGASGVASDDGNHTGAFFTLYPYRLDGAGNDRGVLLAWAWGASRGVDALEYLAAHDAAYAKLLDLKKLVVTGFSRWGKAALLAGLLDERFGVTAPGGSGSGGAAPYRYDSFGNRPFRSAPFGNEYPWGRSTGAETMGDHVRHQTHNSNEMIRRFLNEPRIYQTSTHGYGERLPFDHHELIAAIAPRAVIIDNTNDDYADDAEGDAIGYEGAKPVFEFLKAAQNLALDLFMGGGGHSLKPAQAANIVKFADMVLLGKPLSEEVRKQLTNDPYVTAGTYDKYYGGLKTMMPWLAR